MRKIHYYIAVFLTSVSAHAGDIDTWDSIDQLGRKSAYSEVSCNDNLCGTDGLIYQSNSNQTSVYNNVLQAILLLKSLEHAEPQPIYGKRCCAEVAKVRSENGEKYFSANNYRGNN